RHSCRRPRRVRAATPSWEPVTAPEPVTEGSHFDSSQQATEPITHHTADRCPRCGLSKGIPDMLTSFEFASAWLQARCKTDRGASLVEYALLVALIAVVCIIAITVLGGNASKKFSQVGSAIS